MKAQSQLNWEKYLRFFSETNRNRPTRIAVFRGEPASMEDYWIEDGLPLVGIDVDPDGEKGPEIEILLDNGPAAKGHMTHRVEGATSIKVVLTPDGTGDGIDIENKDGQRTMLRFEDRKA